MPKVDHATFWEEHYAAGRAPWDLGQPAPALTAWLKREPSHQGRAIVLGAGRGHDAIALARAGYTVTAVDFSKTALQEARALAEAEGATVTFLERDIFALLPEHAGQYDLVFEHTCYCAIDPSRRKAYAELVRRLLKPGGRLVAVFFTHKEPGGPPYATSVEEVRKRFGHGFRFETLEPAPASVPAREGLETFGVLVRT